MSRMKVQRVLLEITTPVEEKDPVDWDWTAQSRPGIGETVRIVDHTTVKIVNIEETAP